MATAIVSEVLRAMLKVLNFLHEPADATVATNISWQPLKDFESFLATLMLVSGTGVLTFRILAATDAAGMGATEVVAHANPTQADAAGDTLVLECTAEQVKDVLKAATHVSVEVDMDATNDIAAVTYVFGRAKRQYSGLTADVIA